MPCMVIKSPSRRQEDVIESCTMIRQVLPIVALIAIFGMQFRDCLAADQQSMRCCESGSCNPSNDSHDCCKPMVVPSASIGAPLQRAVLAAPVVCVVDQVSLFQLPMALGTLRFELDPSQHSPPKLHAFYSSLLI